MSSLEIRVCGRFRLEDKLFEGRHASVYIGKNVQSDVDCAIKCQPKSHSSISFVMNEGKIYEALQGGVGIPHLMWYGQNGDFRFVVTELLGNTLEDYLQICGGKFSLKTTLMIADKILSTIEFIHYKNFLHRDIKPANFLVGMGKKLHQIYAIDFAYSTSYIDPRTKEHRQNHISQSKFVGTLKFSSMNIHQGNRYSRRDDLQSVGLMLIYFLKGSLPWSGAPGETLKQKRKNIKRIFDQTTLQSLCEGLPKQFLEYFAYCRSLKYDEIPDYNHLKRLFKEKFIKEGFQYDYIYDWILIPLRLKDTEISNRVPLNRFTKREDTSLSMCNCDYDFSEDFQLSSYVEEKKVEEKEKKNMIEKVEPPRKKAASTMEVKKKQSKKSDKKGSKDDCAIF